MNSFLIKLLAVCLFLTAVCPIIGASADNNATTATTATTSVANVVEVRGPVYDGSGLTNILSNTVYVDGNTITMDADNFAALHFDYSNNMITVPLTRK